MKRRELVTLIGQRADVVGAVWRLRRHGANHEIWELDDMMIPIPRHRSIAAPTARDILKQTQPKLGRRWWT